MRTRVKRLFNIMGSVGIGEYKDDDEWVNDCSS